MKNQKEINDLISNILGEPKLYDVRAEFRIVYPSVPLELAQAFYNAVEPEHKHLYAITTSTDNVNYCGDLNEALRAAKKISEKNDDTFVLSIEDGNWKAAYGDYLNHADYVGANPAYATCMSILKYMGKV